MTYDYELGQSDLIPDSGAPCEAEPAMCDECAIDEANDVGLCADCAREIQLQQLEDGK